MPFVKLDCGMLDSTLWVDRDARELFVTALLMAEPWETEQEEPQIEVRTLKPSGFVVPAGWYGKVQAAGSGIVRRAGIETERGLDALERLGAPDPESRSHDFDGRRLVRVDGGFIVLNYMRYRERDYTAAERSKRYRENKAKAALGRHAVTSQSNTVTSRRVTQAEVEVDSSVSPSGLRTNPQSHPSRRSGEVDEVVAHYVSKKPKSRPGPKERAKVDARLREGFTVEQLKEAIDGCLARPFTNDAGKTFDSLELIVRDSSKVNQYLAAPKTPAPKPHETPYGQGVSKSELKAYSPWGS